MTRRTNVLTLPISKLATGSYHEVIKFSSVETPLKRLS